MEIKKMKGLVENVSRQNLGVKLKTDAGSLWFNIEPGKDRLINYVSIGEQMEFGVSGTLIHEVYIDGNKVNLNKAETIINRRESLRIAAEVAANLAEEKLEDKEFFAFAEKCFAYLEKAND